MFVHLLAGSLVFFWLGKCFGIEVTQTFLVIGAFWGIIPDPASYVLARTMKFNKWAHTHRDNISHSIFPPVLALMLSIFLGFKPGIMVSIALLTHPLLDLFGIGWGVKLFYPLSQKTYKMFYRGQILTTWKQDEVDAEAEQFGDNDWVKNIYFQPNLVGASEWLSLAGFLLLVAIH